MKLAIGNDHVAVEMKKEIKAYLLEKGYDTQTWQRHLLLHWTENQNCWRKKHAKNCLPK